METIIKEQPVHIKRTPFLSLTISQWYRNLKEQFEPKIDEFTYREREIISLIALGLQSKQIAERLFISRHTVDTHRKNIYRKGKFENIRDLILFSILCDLSSFAQ